MRPLGDRSRPTPAPRPVGLGLVPPRAVAFTVPIAAQLMCGAEVAEPWFLSSDTVPQHAAGIAPRASFPEPKGPGLLRGRQRGSEWT